MAGRRPRADEDLRVGRGGAELRPGLLQMLFAGGSASRALATDDLRAGRREDVRPRTASALFRGGPARATATQDLRVSSAAAGAVKPENLRMLADGGEVDDEDFDVSDVDVGDELIMAAEDVMDALQGGGFYSDRVGENDTKVERASKEASRRAKAKILAQALKSFFLLVDED